MEPAIELEPFQTAADFDRAHSHLLEALTVHGERLDEGLLRGIDAFASRGSAGGAYLLDPAERRSCQAMLDFWATQSYNAGHKVRARLAKPDPGLLPQLDDSKCPYVGLRAFGESDSKRYFGREDEVRKLVARLEREHLVIVAGVSGSGKSSLVLAGLIPTLKHDAVPGSKGWNYPAPVVPGRDPLRRLAQSVAVAGGASVEKTQEALLDNPKHLATVLGQSTQPTVLVVDQFEEVFTLQTPETAAACEAFVANLLSAADAGHRVVLTMRSEVQPRLVKYPELHQRYSDAAFPVSEMAQTALRAAIEQPAAAVGLKFQQGVVDGIVKSMVGEENNPPLLQFALTQLWKERVGNLITEAALLKLGNVKQTIATVAQGIWEKFSKEQQNASDAIFLRLAREGDGPVVYRDRVSRDELLALGERANVQFVLRTFTEAHLLRITPTDPARPGEDLIEVVHESLLRNWQRIDQLIAVRNAQRTQRAFLKSLAEQWQDMKYAQGYLLDGFALKEVNDKFGTCTDLSEAERQFLDASNKAENARDAELKREVRKNVALLGIIAIALGMAAMTYWDTSKDLADKNREFASREAAASALKVAQRDPIVGILVAQAALDTKSTPQALGALYNSIWLSQLRPQMSLPPAQAGAVEVLALSADGSRLLTAGGGKVREWALDQNPPAPRLTLEGLDGKALAVQASPDGKRIAAIGEHERHGLQLHYWDATAPGAPLTKIDLKGGGGSGAQLAFSSDGGVLAAFAGNKNRALTVWALNPLQPKPQEVQLPEAPAAISFGANPGDLVILLSNGAVERTRINRGGRATPPTSVGIRCDLTASPQYTLARQSFIAIAPPRACLNQFSINEKFEIDDHTGELGQGIKLSPEGDFVAIPQRWTRAILVGAVQGSLERRLPGAFDVPDIRRMDPDDLASVTSFIQLSDRGRRLTAKRADGSVSIYDLEQPSPWPSATRDDEFAPGGLRYATISRPRQESATATLEVREWPSKRLVASAEAADGMTLDLFTGDGRYVVASGSGRAIVLDLAGDGKPLSAPADRVHVGSKHIILSRKASSGRILQLVNGEERSFANPVIERRGELIVDQIAGAAMTTLVLFRIANDRFAEFARIEVDKGSRLQFEATGRYLLTEKSTAPKEVETRIWALGDRAATLKQTIAGRLSQVVADRDDETSLVAQQRANASGDAGVTAIRLSLKTGAFTPIDRPHTISSTGRYVARFLAGSDGLEVLEARSLKRKLSISGLPKLAFSPNDSFLAATYAEGNSLTLYNLAEGRAIAEISIDGVSGTDFDAAGVNLIVRTSSGKELIPLNVTVVRGIAAKLTAGRTLNDTERCEHLRDEDACGRVRR